MLKDIYSGNMKKPSHEKTMQQCHDEIIAKIDYIIKKMEDDERKRHKIMFRSPEEREQLLIEYGIKELEKN